MKNKIALLLILLNGSLLCSQPQEKFEKLQDQKIIDIRQNENLESQVRAAQSTISQPVTLELNSLPTQALRSWRSSEIRNNNYVSRMSTNDVGLACCTFGSLIALIVVVAYKNVHGN